MESNDSYKRVRIGSFTAGRGSKNRPQTPLQPVDIYCVQPFPFSLLFAETREEKVMIVRREGFVLITEAFESIE